MLTGYSTSNLNQNLYRLASPIETEGLEKTVLKESNFGNWILFTKREKFGLPRHAFLPISLCP